MGLTVTQIKVAKSLAAGCSITDAARRAGIARATIYNYQKSQDFNETVKLFMTDQAVLSVSDEADIEQSRADELAIREYIRPLAEETCGLVLDLVRAVRERGVKDLSPRQIQGLMNSAVEAIECLRKGNDRISGLEVLLDELSKTQEVHAAKIVPLTLCNSTETDEGAS